MFNLETKPQDQTHHLLLETSGPARRGNSLHVSLDGAACAVCRLGVVPQQKYCTVPLPLKQSRHARGLLINSGYSQQSPKTLLRNSRFSVIVEKENKCWACFSLHFHSAWRRTNNVCWRLRMRCPIDFFPAWLMLSGQPSVRWKALCPDIAMAAIKGHWVAPNP